MKKIEINQVPLFLSVFRPTFKDYSKALELYESQGESSDSNYDRLNDYLSFAGKYVSSGDNLFFRRMSEKGYDNIDWNNKVYSEIEAKLLMPEEFSELEKGNGCFSRQIKVFNTCGILKLDDKLVKDERFGSLIYKRQGFWKNLGKSLSETLNDKEKAKFWNEFELKGYKISREDYPGKSRILTSERY